MSLLEIWSIISGIIVIIFTTGKIYERLTNKNKTVDNKVDTHDGKINNLSDKVDKMIAKVNVIESENKANKDNIHSLKTDLGLFQTSTNRRFEKSEKNQFVTLMLISQLCEKQGIDTSMAEFLIKE